MLSMVAAVTASLGTLQAQWIEIARHSPGRVGAVAVCLETGEKVALRANEPFPAQSVIKLPIALAALDTARQQGWKYDHPIPVLASDIIHKPYPSPTRDAFQQGRRAIPLAQLVRDVCRVSDNTGADVLLRTAGGPLPVAAYMKQIGLPGIQVGNGFKVFAAHKNTMTPETTVQLLRAVWQPSALPAEAATLLRGAMAACETGPRRIRGLLPAGASVAHKTGSSLTSNGYTAATNDAGVMTLPNGRHVAIAVFVAEARAAETASEHTIARLAQAAWQHWGRRTPERPRSSL